MKTTTASQASLALLATDALGSPVAGGSNGDLRHISYTSFGHTQGSSRYRTGFTAQLKERAGDTYLLGNGYRGYSPSLMRFMAADEYSPFASGGLNSYAYCGGAPTIRTDPDGHNFVSSMFKGLANRVGRTSSTKLVRKNQKLTEYIARIDRKILRSDITVTPRQHEDAARALARDKHFKPVKLDANDVSRFIPDPAMGGFTYYLPETLQSRRFFSERVNRNNQRLDRLGKAHLKTIPAQPRSTSTLPHYNELFANDGLPSYAYVRLGRP